MKWDDIAVPCDLPETVDEISYERVVMNAGTTWDYIPWHFDPDYARSHGHPTIFVNTMHLAGFVDRIATDWAGPYSRVVRRKVSLKLLSYGRVEEAAKGTVRQTATLNVGISDEKAREIGKFIKGLGLKGVSHQVQGQQLRVSGKKRDDLQTAISKLRDNDFGIPLQFENFRD